jgi:isoleucyl-tRNA synthetase
LKGRDVVRPHLDDDAVDDSVEPRVAFHPEFDYAAYESDGRASSSPRRSRRGRGSGGRTFGEPVARCKGRARAHPLPASALRADLARRARRLRHARRRHRRRPHAPGPRRGRLQHRVRYGLDIYAPVGPGGHFLETVELFAGQRVFDANPTSKRR